MSPDGANSTGNTTATDHSAMDAVPDVHDRITEAYFGQMGDELGRSSRERIHWICSHATGARVLDVGCSQGISAILLGREGKIVTGVDVARRSIDQARDFLAQESLRIRENVSFVCGDFLSLDAASEPFDTVILGEVLEHLTHPEAFVRAAAERLTEGGRLIVTVPYGVNDFPDHKQTFYLAEPWRLISKRFSVEEVEFFGKWIGFVGRKRPATEDTPGELVQASLVAEAEAVFQKIERDLTARVKQVSKRASEIQARLQAATKEKTKLQGQVSESQIARQKSEGEARRLEAELDETRSSAETLRAELKAVETQFAEEKLRFGRDYAELEGQTLDAMGKLEAAELELQERREAANTLEAKLKEAETVRHSVEARVAFLESERGSHKERISALDEQIKEYQARLDRERTAAMDRERDVARSEGELAAANQLTERYRVDAEKAMDASERERAARFEMEKQNLLAERRIEDLSTRLGETNAALSERVDEITSLKSHLEQLRAERADTDREIAELGAALAEAKGQSEELRDQLAAFERDRQGEREALGIAEEQHLQAERRAGQLSEQLGQVQNELSNRSSEAQALQSALDDANRTAQERLQGKEAELRAATESLKQTQAKVDELTAALQTARSQQAEIQAQVDQAQKENKALRDRVASAEKQQNAADTKAQSVQKYLETARAEVESEKQAARNALSRLEAAEAQQRSEQAKNEELQQELQQAASQAQELRRQLDRSQQRLASAEGQVQKTRSMISFQLGHALIQATKSWQGAVSLPRRLRAISRDARERREDKAANKHSVSSTSLQSAAIPGQTPSSDVVVPANNNRQTSSSTNNQRPIEVPLSTGVTPLSTVSKGGSEFSKANRPVVKQTQILNDRLEWHEIPVTSGDHVVINVAVTYEVAEGVKNRKAVMVVKAYDAKGQVLDVACGKLAKSALLEGYFKYVPCSNGKVVELHDFKVPEGVVKISVGFSRFQAAKDDRIFINTLEINVKSDLDIQTAFIPPSPQAAEISILGWPEYPKNGKLYVMGIMDEFTAECFEHDLNLIQPRPDNWYALAEKYRPEFIFIESAWKGNGGSWQYRVAEYANKPGNEIAHICQYAQDKGIPTVFWNKEDPVHHQKFMCSAKLVDHIFTTDANMCDSYRKHTANANVYSLPFAAQPALHKPAPLSGRMRRTCFAGSWYGNRHVERGEAMQWLLRVANKYGLDIFDRNYGTGIFPFPDEYQSGIKGSLPYKALCAEYSRYRVFLNVNSVTDSPTMLSRRVFELMACGTPVVSTYARGIEELFEADAVWLVNNEKEANEAIHTLLTDDAEWRRRSLAGIREVFSRHTYAHRLNEIFTKIGIDEHVSTAPPLLLVAKVFDNSDAEMLLRAADQQEYRNFSLLIEAPSAVRRSRVRSSVEFVEEGYIASESLSIKADDFAAVGWLSPRLTYGRYYLRDLANAMSYQPDAKGWAKAFEQDAYAFGHSAMLGCALWQPETFVSEWRQAAPEQNVKQSGLFSIDSSEWATSLKQEQLARV